MEHVRYIELLAPARDLATGIEAIRHGADAVYIGAPKFGARAAAGNSVDDIRQLADFARPYGAKVYVTLNTIIYDNELNEVQSLVGELEQAGVDALIVQDMALLRMLPPDTNRRMQLHASTQMDNRTADKVAWLRDLGFEQVVLARELTLEEISAIHRLVPDVRLEVFVHGSICVSYNGQCYTSQHCFSRSANRGQCAQFCRMPFDLIEAPAHTAKGKPLPDEERVLLRQKHLLSLRDMNRSNDLEALLDAGASSLKIEGRLKDTAYVKNVVAYYRQRLDEVFKRRPEYRRSSIGTVTLAFQPDPAKSFNRGFTDYFLHGRTSDMANTATPKSMGEPIGRANIVADGIKLTDASRHEATAIHNGDGLCFLNEADELIGFRVNRVDGNMLRISGEGLRLADLPKSPLLLYRNHDQQFTQLLSRPTATRKVAVRWLLRETADGFLLRLTREGGASVEKAFPYPHEVARSSQSEQFTRQLSRLGDTPYECTDVATDLSRDWFIPNSVLAEWRREVIREADHINPQFPIPPSQERDSNPSLSVPSLNHISYQGNVANRVARQFYLDRGAKQVDWAMEVEPPKTTDDRQPTLMTCRYCIRYELGMCKKLAPATHKVDKALFLRLADGRRFRLHFDCRNCQMLVMA